MTLAEQLEQAKRRQEIADLDAGDQRTAAEFAKRISLPPLELSADIRTLLDPPGAAQRGRPLWPFLLWIWRLWALRLSKYWPN